MEYYLALKRVKELYFYNNDEPWSMLSETSLTKEATCFMVPFKWNEQNRKTQCLSGTDGKEQWETRVQSSFQDDRILELVVRARHSENILKKN